MRVIRPVTIESAALVSSNVAEPAAGEVLWSAATNYALDALVIRTQTHRVSQNLVAGVHSGTPETTPSRWLDIGPTNAWAMFDQIISTQTTATDNLTVVLKPGRVNAMQLFGLLGNQVTVTMHESLGGAEVYNKTSGLHDAIITDWYAYFFEPPVQQTALTLIDLPPYSDGHITVTLTGTGLVAIGALIVGSSYELGLTRYGLQPKLKDFSRISTDQFGHKYVVRGLSSRDLRGSFEVLTTQMVKVQSLIAELLGIPCVVIGADGDDYAWAATLGVITDFTPSIDYFEHTLCTIDVEGFV